MKKMKALLSIAVSISFVLGLAACSSTGSTPSSSGTATKAPAASAGENKKQDPVTISFAWWGDAKRHEKYNAIADMYQKEHPNVKIERQ
jgi:multiple sugar transport system substrate-binding protein